MINKLNPFYIALYSSIFFLVSFFTLSALGVIQESVATELFGQASRLTVGLVFYRNLARVNLEG